MREMCSNSGSIVARYSYDPYGRTTLVSGSNLATKQYAGMYMHQPSGLYLTRAGDGSSTGRPFDPATGRWLSRDPIGEDGGINLYAYTDNDPIDGIDPWGLFSVVASEFGGAGDANHNGYGPFNAGNDYKGPMVDPNKPGASLPATLPSDQRMVKITNPANGKSVVAPLVDKGPHNTNDPYWDPCNKNSGRPMAESQYANKTKDQLGRVPTNPAGIDLTPATMNALGVPGSPGTRQAPVNWDFVK
jgi:RHS repeat-associated protein